MTPEISTDLQVELALRLTLGLVLGALEADERSPSAVPQEIRQ